jgi:hypothetical protein
MPAEEEMVKLWGLRGSAEIVVACAEKGSL